MNLEQQIKHTISAYKKACKKENLNIKYLNSYDLQYGICNYCYFRDFEELQDLIENKTNGAYVCNTPKASLFYFNSTNRVLKLHQQRIAFLQELLKETQQPKRFSFNSLFATAGIKPPNWIALLFIGILASLILIISC